MRSFRGFLKKGFFYSSLFQLSLACYAEKTSFRLNMPTMPNEYWIPAKATHADRLLLLSHTSLRLYNWKKTTPGEEAKLVLEGASSHKVSEDGRVHTFKLRPVNWYFPKNEGNAKPVPITAQHWVKSFRFLIDPRNPGHYMAHLMVDSRIKGAAATSEGRGAVSALGVEALDDETLVIRTEAPVSFLPEVLTNPIFSPLYSTSQDFKDPFQVAYSGPFVPVAFEETGKRAVVTFAKNEGFPFANEISVDELKVVQDFDLSSKESLLLSNQVDFVIADSKESVFELKKSGRFKFGKQEESVYYLEMNQRPGKFFEDQSARQALRNVLSQEKVKDEKFIAPLGGKENFVQVANHLMPPRWSILKNSSKFQAPVSEGDLKKLKEKKQLILLTYGDDMQDKFAKAFSDFMLPYDVKVDFNRKESPGSYYGTALLAGKGEFDWDVKLSGWTCDYSHPTGCFPFSRDNIPNYGGYSSHLADLSVQLARTTEGEQAGYYIAAAEFEVLQTSGVIPLFLKARPYAYNGSEWDLSLINDRDLDFRYAKKIVKRN